MLAEVSDGAEFKVYLLYDGEEFDKDKSHLVYSSGGKRGRLPVRVKPRQTAHWGVRLYVEGYGFVKLYGMELWYEPGGDLYV